MVNYVWQSVRVCSPNLKRLVPTCFHFASSPVVKYFPLCSQVDKERTKIEMKVQQSSTSRDSGGKIVEEVSSEKPETSLGCRSNPGAVQQKQQPAVTKRYAAALQISKQHIHNLLNFKVRFSRERFSFVCVCNSLLRGSLSECNWKKYYLCSKRTSCSPNVCELVRPTLRK